MTTTTPAQLPKLLTPCRFHRQLDPCLDPARRGPAHSGPTGHQPPGHSGHIRCAGSGMHAPACARPEQWRPLSLPSCPPQPVIPQQRHWACQPSEPRPSEAAPVSGSPALGLHLPTAGRRRGGGGRAAGAGRHVTALEPALGSPTGSGGPRSPALSEPAGDREHRGPPEPSPGALPLVPPGGLAHLRGSQSVSVPATQHRLPEGRPGRLALRWAPA